MRLLIALLLAFAMVAPAAAHESLPVIVELTQQDATRYSLVTRAPGNLSPQDVPPVSLRGSCEQLPPSGRARQFACAGRPTELAIGKPAASGAPAVLLKASFANGERLSAAAPPGSGSLLLPREETVSGVLTGYVKIGVVHILTGFDHLLFLACLVLIARTWRRTAITVTGFTIGHAVTITLATLGLVRVNSGAVEAIIALSIVFLAAELVRGDRGGLVFRKPAIIATAFGLLHGLGFAGALMGVGTAQTRPILSLVGFNFGVEAGQLAFVAAALLLGQALVCLRDRIASPRIGEYAMLAFLTLVGSVGGYWFVERSVGILLEGSRIT
ncbi:HupE/UreJ family protein [Croceicoccus pelagius]|uniref:Membrane protein n=1 Tax=Croceicoccus pelagius TaxID=1703341 RepID=A0A916YLY4_9SPHN|nr:HupE/UreJ family protein [Croceicoccus pelagius]GGD50736.1 membrane protein [Croceicoccus pelagius]